MKKKILIILFILFTISFLSAEEKKQLKFLWPLPESKGSISMGPGWQVHPKNGTKYFSAGYFLKVEKDLPVFAVHDGQIIDTYFAFILDNYRIVCGDTLNEVIDLANNKYKKYGIQPDDFMCGVWFDIGNGEKITYRGLSVTKFTKLKEGQFVNKGDIIGYSGYYKYLYEEPHINITLGKNGKVGDIGPYLLGVKNDLGIIKYEPKKKHSIGILKEEFEIFRTSLEEGHPGLYTYTRIQRLNELFDVAYKKIDHSMTSNDFYDLLYPIVAEIKCMHTKFEHHPAYKKTLIGTMPVILMYIEDKLYVSGNYSSQSGLNPGTEILSINNESTEEVRKYLESKILSDGYNKSNKKDALLNYFNSIYNYYYGPRPFYIIKYSTPGGKDRTIKLPQMSYSEIRKIAQKNNKNQPEKIKENVSMKIVNQETALLKIKSFSIYTTEKESIEKFFQELKLKKIPNLIIDLRKNLGGESGTVGFLYSFFADKPFSTKKYYQAKSNRSYNFFKYTSGYSEKDIITGDFKMDNKTKSFRLFPGNKKEKSEIEIKMYNPSTDLKYSGAVYILVTGHTASAAANFTGLMYKNKKAVVVGRETGGCFYEVNAIKSPVLIFRETGLQLQIPLIKSVYFDDPDPRIPRGHGILPDYEIAPVLTDEINKTDTILNFTYDLINKQGKSKGWWGFLK